MKNLFLILCFVLVTAACDAATSVTASWDLSASEPLGTTGVYS